MKKIDIRKRIQWSFMNLVSVFVINALITMLLLNENKTSSIYISEVIEPSVLALNDFKKMMIESKMYTTNWVFLRSKQEDKEALKALQRSDYPLMKEKLRELSADWDDENLQDTLALIYAGFEKLILTEKEIMASLQEFSDYDDPVNKFNAERIVEDEVLPQTATLINKLDSVIDKMKKLRKQQTENLHENTQFMFVLLGSLAVVIIVTGFLLSAYLTRIIVRPINKIIGIINLLGKGVIKKVNHTPDGGEIGEMIHSVNNLSDKLLATASFAYEVGVKNFDTHYKPLSKQDTLGKALITMRDNLKESEGSLRTSITELKKRNSELDKFVYSVSHDLRAPLRSILGVVEISEDMSDDEIMLKHLEMIKGSVKKLDTFILDILDYSRNSRMEIKKDEINFTEILDDVSTNLKYMGNSNMMVDIEVNINNDICFKSDKSRLTVILNNLVSNAIRYQNPKAASPFVAIDVDLSESGANIAVKDNGIGIPEDMQEKIFEMFFRVSTSSIGSGLGLYIVKETVDKLQGEISIVSEPGKGTTFNMFIPNS